jgi:uncharacterized SAM-binding protein YcdF (DUF218 family)
MKMALTLTVVMNGCADLRDTFLPYRPNEREIDALIYRVPPRQRYDVAITLGCPADPDGSASLCQRCRVNRAVQAYHCGQVGKILMSGNAAHSPVVEADVMAALAESIGVPAADVLRERRALTTWQNLRYATAMMRRAHFSTALIISTADHLPRARRIAHFYGLDDMHTSYAACDRKP